MKLVSVKQGQLQSMFIHIRYGSEPESRIMVFERMGFITAIDVLKKVQHLFDRRSSKLYLIDEYGIALKDDVVVQRARTYLVRRQPR